MATLKWTVDMARRAVCDAKVYATASLIAICSLAASQVRQPPKKMMSVIASH
jgi:hypothetical protein